MANLDPVPAGDPAAIIAVARRFQAGLHGEQVFHRDTALFGVFIACEVFGEEIRQGGVYRFDMALFDGDADQRRNHAFRCRLHVRRAARPGAVVVLLENEFAAVLDQQAVQARQFLGRPLGIAEIRMLGKHRGRDQQHHR